MRAFLLIFLGICTFGAKASKIEEAYKALSIYDYFKAKKLFYSQLGKSSKSPAGKGLAIIFYRTDNPFHNLDSAAKYISISGNAFKEKRLKTTYSGFTTDSAGIAALADSIAVKIIQKLFKEQSLARYEHFLNTNTFASMLTRAEAFYLRDELCYKSNLSYNRSDSTRQFLLRFPESFFLKESFILLDKQVFEEQTVSKTKEQYLSFIEKNPKNKFIDLAQDELFAIYRTTNDLAGLDHFVKNFKTSNSITEAWKLLYSLSVKSYNTSELQSFVERYPDFPFKASIHKEIELNAKVLIPIHENDYYGFIDSTGKFVIPPVYEAVMPFKEGLAVTVKNDSAAFINKENDNAFKSFYEEAYAFTNGMAPVNVKGEWYFINRQGQKISDAYEEIQELGENVYVIKQNKKYGAADAYGNIIIQPQFDKMGDFKNGMAYYMNNNLYGFVSKEGVASKAQYQWISDFDENRLAIIKLNNHYGLIDQNDNLILSPVYDLVIKAKGNIFIVVRNNKYGFYSGMGCFYSEIDYDFKKELSPAYYTNGKLFKLLKNNKQALMDLNGRISIDYGQYEEVHFAQSNLIRVKRRTKYGFVDRRLSMAIPAKYNTATDFEDSLSICTLKQETFLVNTKGEEILKTKGHIDRIEGGYYWIKEEGGNRLLDKKGRLVFSSIESYQFAPGYLVLEFENKSKKVLKL